MVIEAGVRIPAIPNASTMVGMPGTRPTTSHAKKNKAMAQPVMPSIKRKRFNAPGSRMCFCFDN